MNVHTNTELGNSPDPQLYDLSTDIGQIRNTAAQHTGVVRAMSARLREIIDGEGTREAVPGTRG
jgi:hypothetical protein